MTLEISTEIQTKQFMGIQLNIQVYIQQHDNMIQICLPMGETPFTLPIKQENDENRWGLTPQDI